MKARNSQPSISLFSPSSISRLHKHIDNHQQAHTLGSSPFQILNWCKDNGNISNSQPYGKCYILILLRFIIRYPFCKQWKHLNYEPKVQIKRTDTNLSYSICSSHSSPLPSVSSKISFNSQPSTHKTTPK